MVMKEWNGSGLKVRIRSFEPVWDVVIHTVVEVIDVETGNVVFHVTGYAYCELSDLYHTIIAAFEPGNRAVKGHEQLLTWIKRP